MMGEEARMARRTYPRLHDTMSRADIVTVLDKLIFTAAHNWEQSVVIDRNVRDMIVRALKQPARERVTDR